MGTSLRVLGLKALGLVFGVVVCAAPALALPAPMSDQDLLEKSDLVALVQVLSVTCLSASQDLRTGEALPNYSAKLKLLQVVKGDEPQGGTVSVYFHALPSGLLGPWTVYYYPGEVVWTHLQGKNGDYTTIWWNARGKTLHAATVTALPTTPGETVAAPPSSE
jgi:hypothetical protein